MWACLAAGHVLSKARRADVAPTTTAPRNCDEYRTGIRAEKIDSGFEKIMRDDAV